MVVGDGLLTPAERHSRAIRLVAFEQLDLTSVYRAAHAAIAAGDNLGAALLQAGPKVVVDHEVVVPLKLGAEIEITLSGLLSRLFALKASFSASGYARADDVATEDDPPAVPHREALVGRQSERAMLAEPILTSYDAQGVLPCAALVLGARGQSGDTFALRLATDQVNSHT